VYRGGDALIAVLGSESTRLSQFGTEVDAIIVEWSAIVAVLDESCRDYRVYYKNQA
jgi:hypothetical protein